MYINYNYQFTFKPKNLEKKEKKSHLYLKTVVNNIVAARIAGKNMFNYFIYINIHFVCVKFYFEIY